MDQLENLCVVLGEEARVCAALVGVLRDEQRAVVTLQPGAIFACLEQGEVLQEKLASLAARRRALMQKVAIGCGSVGASATAVLPLLPPAPQARLRTELRQLRRTLLEARGLERQNARLIGSGLETTSPVLDIVTDPPDQPREPAADPKDPPGLKLPR